MNFSSVAIPIPAKAEGKDFQFKLKENFFATPKDLYLVADGLSAK